MHHPFPIKAHCSIALPQAICFAYITDFEHDPDWWPPVQESRRICGHGVGAIYEQVASVGILHFSSLIEVTAFTPDQSMAFTITSHGIMHCHVQYTFVSDGPMTTFTMDSTITLIPRWLRRAAPLLRSVLQRQTTAHFALLKAHLEARSPQS